jgi:hypothetical protein
MTTPKGHKVKGERDICRCHNPGCSYVSGKEYQVNGHVNSSHKQMANDIKKLGWFWGTIYTMMKSKTTIAEALGEGVFGNAQWINVIYHFNRKKHFDNIFHKHMQQMQLKNGKPNHEN